MSVEAPPASAGAEANPISTKAEELVKGVSFDTGDGSAKLTMSKNLNQYRRLSDSSKKKSSGRNLSSLEARKLAMKLVNSITTTTVT